MMPKKPFLSAKGVILLQPQTGVENDKVNLILLPYQQIFLGLSIKHFIHRGLQRSNFFTAGSAPVIITETSEL
jgi:hypothetical protein